MNTYRSTPNELNYYGSDLNKFIDKCCTRKMTAINIDLLMYKKSNKHMRIIESKHTGESIPRSQMESLVVLKDANIQGITFEVFIVAGDPPYNTAQIQRLKPSGVKTVDRSQLIGFLNYEIDFDDLQPVQPRLI